MSTFFDEVYKLVQQVPPGKVTTYGEIAKKLGTKDSRRIGHALHANPYEGEVPCHRVVNKDGRVAPGFAFDGPDEQRRRLEEEGVKFINDSQVDLKTCLYTYEP